jgi:hypothetical protein
MRNAPASPDTTYTPGQLYTSAVDPIMDSDNYHWVYIVGKWKETDTENFDSPGRQRTVSGQITVPMIYKTLLATCEYIDPYLDGSMFLKVGASVDQGRLYVLQTIKSMSLTNPSEVV